jgi:O-antigen ligase
VNSSPVGTSLQPRHGAWFAAVLVAVPVALMIATSEPGFFIVATGVIALALITLHWPVASAIALVASVSAQQMGAIGPLTMTRAMVVFALFITIIVALAQRQNIVHSRLALPFAALIGWMAISAGGARNSALAVDEILRWSIALVAFLILLQWFVGSSERQLTIAVAVIGIVAALQATLGILQSALALGPPSFEIAGRFSRAFGTFGRPNTFAGYLEMTLFSVLWLGFYQLRVTWAGLRTYRVDRLSGFAHSRPGRRALAVNMVLTVILLASASIIASGVLISFSRGAWLGVIVGAAMSLAIVLRTRWIAVAAAAPLIVLMGFGAAAIGLVPPALVGRVESIVIDSRPFDASTIVITNENFAAVERMAHWQAGWDMFLDHPVMGVGPGNFNDRYPDYFVRSEFRFSQGHAHNYYIHALAETGLVGLAIYLTLVTSALMLAVRVALKATGFPLALAMGSVGTTTAVMAHNVFENLHVLNLSIQLVAAWTLAITAHRMLHTLHTRSQSEMDYQSS